MEKATKFDLIRIDPQEYPIYLVVNAFAPDDPETAQYWYEEGTCPTNVLRGEVHLVVTEGDTDPHGIFTYIRAFDRPAFLDRSHSGVEWEAVLPEVFEDKTIEGEAFDASTLIEHRED
jgi:hypothetical protein